MNKPRYKYSFTFYPLFVSHGRCSFKCPYIRSKKGYYYCKIFGDELPINEIGNRDNDHPIRCNACKHICRKGSKEICLLKELENAA